MHLDTSHFCEPSKCLDWTLSYLGELQGAGTSSLLPESDEGTAKSSDL